MRKKKIKREFLYMLALLPNSISLPQSTRSLTYLPVSSQEHQHHFAEHMKRKTLIRGTGLGTKPLELDALKQLLTKGRMFSAGGQCSAAFNVSFTN